MRFGPSQKLRTQADFLAVKAKGTRVHCGAFVFQVLAYEEESKHPKRRFGVIASRKTGNSVKRSHAKRVFREIFRQNQNHLPLVCDLVIVAFSSFDEFNYKELEERYLKACAKVSNG